MQNIVILGSTGSIGRNTLKVVQRFKDKFRLIGICADSDIITLRKQIGEFKPEFAAVSNEEKAEVLERQSRQVKVLKGFDGVCKLASLKNVDTVVIAIAGGIALIPLIEAIKAGKKIALANKEALVIAGHIVKKLLKENKQARIIPIDSEQNAIFQCLKGYDHEMINTLYLTASGGPFFDWKKNLLKNVSPKQALVHPRWQMGKKITVDSATLMNKGFEVIEAKWLFDIALEKIKVVVHRQALVHSLVEFIDSSILGQLAVTDMQLPIQYALSYPERWHNNGALRLDLLKIKSLSFEKPDLKKFPCLELAYYAAGKNEVLPCVLNAANEEAVEGFLNGKIRFTDIPRIIEKLFKKHNSFGSSLGLEGLLSLDREVRVQTKDLIGKGKIR